MKVFFDGKIFSSQKQGGISRVGFELMKEFSKRKELEQIFYRGLYVDNYPFERGWFKKYYGFKKHDFLRSRIFNLLDNICFNYFYNINADKDLIFHSLYYRIPNKPKGPVIVHCHDMIHELFGGSKKAIKYKERAFSRANLIIAISKSTKKDLCNIYPEISPEKVSVVHLGVSDIFFKRMDLNTVNNTRPYVLYVGARSYKYKNFDFLLDIFIEKKYFQKFDLIIVGGEKNLTKEQKKRILNTEKSGNWLLQKFCDDKSLAELYSKASVFIYPSLYEGFGIPPLEAMASGCPVLASNLSSISEVVGNAGLLFDPTDKRDFTTKLDAILSDRSLSADLVKKGRSRASQFTWRATANQIYNEYLKFL